MTFPEANNEVSVGKSNPLKKNAQGIVAFTLPPHPPIHPSTKILVMCVIFKDKLFLDLSHLQLFSAWEYIFPALKRGNI